jgi:hypothetical protein
LAVRRQGECDLNPAERLGSAVVLREKDSQGRLSVPVLRVHTKVFVDEVALVFPGIGRILFVS